MEKSKKVICPDCGDVVEAAGGLDRRGLLKSAAVAAAASALPLWAEPRVTAAPTPDCTAEKLVKTLYEKLNDEQKKKVCFDWDYKDPNLKNVLLRTHVSNNWQITKPTVDG